MPAGKEPAGPCPKPSARPYSFAWQSLAIMGAFERQLRPLGNDAVGVDMPMAGVVVVLDVGKVHGLGYAGPLIELAQPVRQVRIVFDAPQVALEMAVVHRIEAHEGGKQTPVGLGEKFTGEIALFGETLLEPVQLREQLVERRLIGFAGRGEAGTVHAIVDPRVDTLVERVDLGA